MLLEQVRKRSSVRGNKQEVEANTEHYKRLCAEPRLQANLCGHGLSIRKKGWCNKRRVRAAGGAAEQPNRTTSLIRPPLQVPHTTTIGSGYEHEGSERYFGILYNGEIVARGIELRRHDTPAFIRKFQAELIKTLLDCKTLDEVYSIGYERALKLVTKALDKIMNEKIPLQELAVSKTLRKNVNKYRSIFPHVAAAIQLAHRGKNVKEGDDISFIYRDLEHHNPLCQVTPLELADANINFDRKKYREMLLDAAETVLTTFNLPREAYSISIGQSPG